MRILIAHEAAAGGGGVESYLAALIPALAARGHQLAFLHHNPRSEQGPDAAGACGHAGGERERRRAGRRRPIACGRGGRTSVSLTTCGSSTSRSASRSEWPVVKMMHGYFGTCIGGQKAHAFPGVVPCRARVRAAVSRAVSAAALRAAAAARDDRAVRLGIAAARAVRSLRAGRRRQPSHGRGVRPARHRGRPPDRPRRSFPRTREPASARPLPAHPTVVFAGRMTRIKGGAVLVRAAAAANRAHARAAPPDLRGRRSGAGALARSRGPPRGQRDVYRVGQRAGADRGPAQREHRRGAEPVAGAVRPRRPRGGRPRRARGRLRRRGHSRVAAGRRRRADRPRDRRRRRARADDRRHVLDAGGADPPR